MKSLSCWFKSKDDKSMFQERIPVSEKKKRKRALDKVSRGGLRRVLPKLKEGVRIGRG